MRRLSNEKRPSETTVVGTEWITQIKQLTRFGSNATEDFPTNFKFVRKRHSHGYTVSTDPNVFKMPFVAYWQLDEPPRPAPSSALLVGGKSASVFIRLSSQ